MTRLRTPTIACHIQPDTTFSMPPLSEAKPSARHLILAGSSCPTGPHCVLPCHPFQATPTRPDCRPVGATPTRLQGCTLQPAGPTTRTAFPLAERRLNTSPTPHRPITQLQSATLALYQPTACQSRKTSPNLYLHYTFSSPPQLTFANTLACQPV